MKLKLEQVVKIYDSVVLDHLSIDLGGYQSIAIIGPSGCGKSTLLRLLAGIEFPDSGKIQVGSWIVSPGQVAAYQKTIGFVFQAHNLFPHLSLKRNITLILEKTRGMTKPEASSKADELLELLHLEAEKDRKPARVSGGQAQRASIARALCMNPDLLFLDEPTASLDPILTHEVLMAVKDLRTLGKDFIFVTHEIAFVQSFADYIIFMDQGKIVEHGDVTRLNRPKTDRLVAFLKNVTYA
jgi:ABC-type polar amino acid transport system ATPase subunit